jgi:hypothetical protein
MLSPEALLALTCPPPSPQGAPPAQVARAALHAVLAYELAQRLRDAVDFAQPRGRRLALALVSRAVRAPGALRAPDRPSPLAVRPTCPSTWARGASRGPVAMPLWRSYVVRVRALARARGLVDARSFATPSTWQLCVALDAARVVTHDAAELMCIYAEDYLEPGATTALVPRIVRALRNS